ncbi:hypothetical protein TDB9533_04807 [Thalassocella blandensis]|nr:hypothetical protein TDB9533_04807 [Thalassocella blandensis]
MHNKAILHALAAQALDKFSMVLICVLTLTLTQNGPFQICRK